MVRILAVADEVDESLGRETMGSLRPDVVVSCGDLPFDHLEYLVTLANVPLLYVRGNHDPGAGPDPGGCTPLDGRAAAAAGLRFAGLGGSHRYSDGPNQYTEPQMRRRARRLARRSRVAGIDVLVTHAPPYGLGDEPTDPCHRGFEAFGDLVRRLRPALVVHGHIHPYGRARADRAIGDTAVVNVIPYRLLEVDLDRRVGTPAGDPGVPGRRA